jgi:hypothetical protein
VRADVVVDTGEQDEFGKSHHAVLLRFPRKPEAPIRKDKGIEMWTCRACGLGMMFKSVRPEIDEESCYFVCIGCGHRNVLMNVVTARDELTLIQPDEQAAGRNDR